MPWGRDEVGAKSWAIGSEKHTLTRCGFRQGLSSRLIYWILSRIVELRGDPEGYRTNFSSIRQTSRNRNMLV